MYDMHEVHMYMSPNYGHHPLTDSVKHQTWLNLLTEDQQERRGLHGLNTSSLHHKIPGSFLLPRGTVNICMRKFSIRKYAHACVA